MKIKNLSFASIKLTTSVKNLFCTGISILTKRKSPIYLFPPKMNKKSWTMKLLKRVRARILMKIFTPIKKRIKNLSLYLVSSRKRLILKMSLKAKIKKFLMRSKLKS